MQNHASGENNREKNEIGKGSMLAACPYSENITMAAAAVVQRHWSPREEKSLKHHDAWQSYR